MVYQNYNGIDLDQVSALIDETEFQNIHTADPSQRTGCGNNDVVSSLSVSDPEFYIPSGPSAPCINIFSVSIENTYIYNNYFTTFTLSNFTSYNGSSFQKGWFTDYSSQLFSIPATVVDVQILNVGMLGYLLFMSTTVGKAELTTHQNQ